MTTEVKVPLLPESVADATVAKWYKKPGDTVKRDENIVDLETDKVMLEVPAPADGVLEKILKAEGSTVLPSEVIAVLAAGSSAQASAQAQPHEATSKPAQAAPTAKSSTEQAKTDVAANELSPAVRRLVAEKDVNVEQVKGSGKAGRITKDDVIQHLEAGEVNTKAASSLSEITAERPEKRVPMTRLRARIAERLVAAQHNAAMLTTFNEINMQPVMNLRARHKEQFEKTHGVKLGLMSFFVKAAVEALKRLPTVNASIDGNDVIYHGYYDVGIAVSTPRGLVVPVLRDAENMSLAVIEKNIANYAVKARDNKLSIEEMTGGTFTITNGGVFGSMLSTPILNPPQSAILGMHNIVERPIVENKEIVIRPIMYVALSYDHRIIDGRESVTFLVTLKQLLEDPTRLLLEI